MNSRNLLFSLGAIILLTAMPLRGEEAGSVRLLKSDRDGLVFEFRSGEASVADLPHGDNRVSFQVLRLPGCDSYVVEQAEAHHAVPLRVVAWRPYQGEASARLPPGHAQRRLDGSARREARDFSRVLGDIGVRIDLGVLTREPR